VQGHGLVSSPKELGGPQSKAPGWWKTHIGHPTYDEHEFWELHQDYRRHALGKPRVVLDTARETMGELILRHLNRGTVLGQCTL